MVTVKQIGNKIKDLVAKAEEFNALSEEIACDLSEASNEELMELFTKVKNHEIEDAKTLMQCMRDLSCFEEIKEKVDLNIAPEIIEKFNKIMEAKDIIKEAIEVGVLTAAGAHRVYVSMKLDDGDIVWVPQTLEDAARSLVESDSVELLSNAIKERKETGANQALLSCEPDVDEEAIRLQLEDEPCLLALKFSRYVATNAIAAFFIVDDKDSEDNGELYDDLTVCLGNEYPLSDDYMAFVKSDKARYLKVLQERGILTCHQEVSYGNMGKAVLVRFDPEKVVFRD